MQPTTLCNLDCSYCYLPLRRAALSMPVPVAAAVAAEVARWPGPVDVIWHGGEPLTVGIRRLASLMAVFSGVRHHVQTNATLLDDAWCAFFADRDVRVGISIDGPRERNGQRVTWSGGPAYDRIVGGIERLRHHGVEFSAIAVVSTPEPGVATELYEFFVGLGCAVLGVNIEEKEGVNTRRNDHEPADVAAFWAELAAAWRGNPVVRVRELERVMGFVAAEFDGRADSFLPSALDPFPTVAHNGDVVLLSPELAGFADRDDRHFAIGNVLTTSLTELVRRAGQQPWIAEYRRGVERCRQTCLYFDFCGGGQPANRWFEHGRFDVTQTAHCRNSRIGLLEGVLAHASAG